MPSNLQQYVHAEQQKADLISLSRLVGRVIDGDDGQQFLEWLKQEAGLNDVVLPGQFANPSLFPDSQSKHEVNPIDLAIREGRRQMVNMILWARGAEDQINEAMDLKRAQQKEIFKHGIDEGLTPSG